jgi:tocopherol O-methyltransferase
VIRPSAPPPAGSVGHHYDELDPFYRSLWGEHLHHGLWTTGRETPEDAAMALVDDVVRRARVGSGSDVVDVGCGYGATTRLLAAAGARATGLTVSRAQYEHARRAGGDATFHHRDWLESGLPDAGFDAVVAIESLSHMADKRGALAEALRVLRPGGRLVACVWLASPAPRPWEIRWLLEPICREGRLPGLANAGEYADWAREAGFEGVSVDDVSARVSRTWRVCARRLGLAVLQPSSWRYLADTRNSERRFALSVLRILAAYRTGAMRYGILTAQRPATPAA